MLTVTFIAVLVMLGATAISLPVSIANLRDTRRRARQASTR